MSDIPALTHVIMVRHGETEWNRAGRVQGMLDSRLSERGLAQAHAVARALAHESIDLVYASDLGRAQQTAAVIVQAAGLPIRLDSRLRERCYGVLEALTWPEIEHAHPEAFARVNAREPDYAPPAGESPNMFRDRVIPALTEIAHAGEGSRILIITHGGVVGTLYRHAMSMSIDEKRRYALFNASINRFRYVDDTWHLDVWGDTSHLEGLLPGDEP
jgi:2,3-bisphosphoglycerate-dependent phosphoglycerate mutase